MNELELSKHIGVLDMESWNNNRIKILRALAKHFIQIVNNIFDKKEIRFQFLLIG